MIKKKKKNLCKFNNPELHDQKIFKYKQYYFVMSAK